MTLNVILLLCRQSYACYVTKRLRLKSRSFLCKFDVEIASIIVRLSPALLLLLP